MGALIDLTGRSFGELTVIKRVENKGKKPQWLCKCSCGKEIIVLGASLRDGVTKSCGHLKNKFEDLTGKTFGRLTVLAPTDKRDSNRNVIFKCICNCGKEVEVSGHRLKQGNTKSCGCLNLDRVKELGQNNKIDLTGQQFGNLIVIKDSGYRKNNCVLWECQCSCGNKINVKSSSLLHGTKSCGCIKSKGEYQISRILRENGIQFETQKVFSDCRFKDTGRPAFFDFFVDNTYLIEYDGEQHFSYKDEGWNSKENYLKTIERDKIKNEWCKENHYPLIRIPYTKLNSLTIEDLLLDSSEFII